LTICIVLVMSSFRTDEPNVESIVHGRPQKKQPLNNPTYNRELYKIYREPAAVMRGRFLRLPGLRIVGVVVFTRVFTIRK
jgi:hypothetical protein